MKHFYPFRWLIPAAFLCFMAMPVQAQLQLPRASQMASVSQQVGISHVKITYSRPAVAEREIWGSLVPYGMNNLGFGTAAESPWRAGANENTVFKVDQDAMVEGQPLPAGTYGLHMIIHEDDKATIIFSKNSGAWGSYFYDPAEDALRVDVSSREAPHAEQLTYLLSEVTPTSVVASLRWGTKEIPFTVSFDTPEIVLDYIRQSLQDQEGFTRQSWEQAATYSLNNGGDLDEALGWIDAAIAGQFFSQQTFNNMSIKAQILAKQGKQAEAEALMDEAIAMGTVFEIHAYGRQLIAGGNAQKALEVFQKNAKMNKDTWPVDYGLARGYSAVGDYKKALKHLKIAEKRAPDALNQNAIAANVEKLQNGQDIN